MSVDIRDQFDATLGTDDSDANATAATLLGHYKDPALRAIVGVVCALSVVGSLVIIFSYLCFKSRRTKAREILVHISLMDLGVGLANLIGLSVYYDRYYLLAPNVPAPVYIDNLCKTEAFFALYATLGSVFWTTSLMAYLYFRIMYSHTKLALYFLQFCYFFCYGFPLFISLWLVLTGKLGYSPYDSAGWCSLITKNPLDHGTEPVDVFVTIFGYDLWMYLAFLLITLLYLTVRLFVSNKIKATRRFSSENQLRSALQNVDYKFALIPLIFISLRIWTCIDSFTLYAGVKLSPTKFPDKILIYLSGMGDSGQGIANTILFVLFSKNVRESFKRCLRCENSEQSEEEKNVHSADHFVESSRMLDPSASSNLSQKDGSVEDDDEGKQQPIPTYGTVNYS